MNYFNSSFMNSFRLKNYKLSTLRLYFERNNKFAETMTNLGNVYRNSKWSDLKTQNIKDAFTKKRAPIFIMGTLALITVLFLLNWSFGRGYIANIPLLDSLKESISFALIQLINKLNAGLAFIYLQVHLLQRYVTNRIESAKLQLFGIKTSAKTKITNTRDAVNTSWAKITTSSAARARGAWKSVTTTRWLEPSFYLQRCRSILRFFGLQTKRPFYEGDLNYTELFLTTQYPLSRSTCFEGLLSTRLGRTWKEPLFSDEESSYLPIALPYKRLTKIYEPFKWSDGWYSLCLDYSAVLNLNNANRIALYTKVLSPENMNIATSLNLAKQDRWLIRNTLTSEHITKNSNAYTQAKKLVSTNLTSSDTRNSNVWVSTKLTKLNLLDSLEASAGLIELLYPAVRESKPQVLDTTAYASTTLSNLNYLELSRIWAAKKYYMTSSYNNTLYSMEQAPKRVAGLSDKIQKQLLFDLIAEANALALDVNISDISFATLLHTSATSLHSTNQPRPLNLNYLTTENTLLLNSNTSFIRSVSSTRASQNRQPSPASAKVYDFAYTARFRA